MHIFCQTVSQGDQEDGYSGKQKENVPPCTLDMVRIIYPYDAMSNMWWLVLCSQNCKIDSPSFFRSRVQSLSQTAGKVLLQRATVSSILKSILAQKERLNCSLYGKIQTSIFVRYKMTPSSVQAVPLPVIFSSSRHPSIIQSEGLFSDQDSQGESSLVTLSLM